MPREAKTALCVACIQRELAHASACRKRDLEADARGKKHVCKCPKITCDHASEAEVKWLREIAKYAAVFNVVVIDATRGIDLVPNTMVPYLKAKAKLEGALNKLRIATEE